MDLRAIAADGLQTARTGARSLEKMKGRRVSGNRAPSSSDPCHAFEVSKARWFVSGRWGAAREFTGTTLVGAVLSQGRHSQVIDIGAP
jgi:hypothetical protein